MVSPGIIGFVVIFLIAAATVLLVVDMTRRIRRMRYRQEAQDKIAQELRGESVETRSTEAPED